MITKYKKHRQGAHLVIYGPKDASTHARLVSVSSQYILDEDTPEKFLEDLAKERKMDAMMNPLRRFYR